MNFFEAQKPVLVVLKAFGFFTYRLKIDDLTVEENKWHFLYCIMYHACHQGLFLMFHILFVHEVDNYLNDGNSATKFVIDLEGYTVNFSFLIVFYSLFFCQSSQMKFIKTIIKLKQEIENLRFSQKCDNGKLRRSSIKFIVIQVLYITTCVIFFFIILPQHTFELMILMTLNYLVISLFMIFVVHFMKNLVEIIGDLFDNLNLNLKRSVNFFFHEKDANDIFRLHNELTESIRMFNKSFGTIVIGVHIYAFGIMSFEIYFAYAKLVSSNAIPNLMILLISLGNILSFTPIFIVYSRLRHACEKVQEKVLISSLFI